MRIAMVVPGGVDRSGEYRVIPALLALIGRLAAHHDVRVIALMQEDQPGTWHLAGAHVVNIGRGATRLRALRAIHKMHRAAPFDVVHAIWSGPCGLIAAVAGKTLGIPSVVHIGGGELVALPEIGYGGALTWRGRVHEKWVLRTASAVTAASAPVIDVLAHLGIAAQRVALGVDLASWPPREPVVRDRDRPARLIHIASLNRVKDQTTLLRALQSLTQRGVSFEMDVVGEDTLHGEIQRLTQELGLAARIRFHGFLPQRQLRPLLEAADLLALSSRHETGPLVALEAAIAGVPTVGTFVGHIAEWTPHAAVSVPIGDWERLAAVIHRLLDDEDFRIRLAREAQARALSEDADYTAAQFCALYARLT